ncbi:DMT family transporter [Nocardioides sp. S-58]|uniref:DMT family transporter n=1 Tax=Nocardioides renjunii TaxID=3095075 RepID=A0ABU5KE14_9ACTN|nr:MULTISPECIES: DMT family transporter [unclassified Nocardioides]MDZ5663094.1 DMT family transporter [Nocardioides sp. S-58]WQQ23029.1 DMT family transporter [Nocardioides sp. S-34]
MTTTTQSPTGAPGETGAPPAWLPVAAGGVTLVMWASAFVVIRHVAHDVSPGALGSGRLLVAALVVLPLVLRHGWVRPTRREWTLLAVGGIGWFGVYNLALNAGERHVDAGTAAMIIQIGPVIVALLAVPLFGERLHGWLLAGMVVGFAGVAVIARGSSTEAGASVLGVLLVLLAAAMYAVGVLTQKVLLRRLPSVQVVFVSFLMGAVVCLPFSGDLPGIVADGGAELWWIVYLGVLPTAVAFTTWAYALTHTDAGALSLTTFLVPGIATLIAWLTIDEVPPSLTFVGGALAIVGVLMTRRKPRAGA